MAIEEEYRTLEAAEQIIDPTVPSLAEGGLPVTISPTKIVTPEETPGVRRFYRVKLQTKPDCISVMSFNQYETANTQVECEDTLYPDAIMFLFQ